MHAAESRKPWAVPPACSRGRRIEEPEHPYRDCFERDRDRVVHARAFRRLEYKTQVFPNHHGDHFRTRLTHTIEVSQLARTAARALGLNTALAEAIALAHDLGHPPFGHVGEATLDAVMAGAGGFEHNRHSLRTVDEIEEKYAGFRGLNLTYEVREGIAKHATRYDRFDGSEIAEFNPEERSPLEAQLIDLVDHITYNVHDVDDGVEADILDVARLSKVPLFGRPYRELTAELPNATDRELFNETIRRMVDRLVTDLITTTEQRVSDAAVASLADVRNHVDSLAAHSEPVLADLETMADFLSVELYRSPLVQAEMEDARAKLRALFEVFANDMTLLPPRHRERAERVGALPAVADYVAGMTDRYALSEHERLIGGRSR
jgi:dGTPase